MSLQFSLCYVFFLCQYGGWTGGHYTEKILWVGGREAPWTQGTEIPLLYSDGMRTRRFWNNKEEEMKDGESVRFSGSSNHVSVFLHLPLVCLGLWFQVTDKAPVPLSSLPHLPALASPKL